MKQLPPILLMAYRIGEFRCHALRLQSPADVLTLTTAVRVTGNAPAPDARAPYTGLNTEQDLRVATETAYFVWVVDDHLLETAARAGVAFRVVPGFAVPITPKILDKLKTGKLVMQGEWTTQINPLFGTGEMFMTHQEDAESILNLFHKTT